MPCHERHDGHVRKRHEEKRVDGCHSSLPDSAGRPSVASISSSRPMERRKSLSCSGRLPRSETEVLLQDLEGGGQRPRGTWCPAGPTRRSASCSASCRGRPSPPCVGCRTQRSSSPEPGAEPRGRTRSARSLSSHRAINRKHVGKVVGELGTRVDPRVAQLAVQVDQQLPAFVVVSEHHVSDAQRRDGLNVEGPGEDLLDLVQRFGRKRPPSVGRNWAKALISAAARMYLPARMS